MKSSTRRRRIVRRPASRERGRPACFRHSRASGNPCIPGTRAPLPPGSRGPSASRERGRPARTGAKRPGTTMREGSPASADAPFPRAGDRHGREAGRTDGTKGTLPTGSPTNPSMNVGLEEVEFDEVDKLRAISIGFSRSRGRVGEALHALDGNSSRTCKIVRIQSDQPDRSPRGYIGLAVNWRPDNDTAAANDSNRRSGVPVTPSSPGPGPHRRP